VRRRRQRLGLAGDALPTPAHPTFSRCHFSHIFTQSLTSEGDRGKQADAIAQCWAQKRAEHRHILDLIEAGTFTVGGRQVLDAETLDEVRQWAARRVAACEARIAACDKYH